MSSRRPQLVAAAIRRLCRSPATHLVLHAPWVDLTTSTSETAAFAERDTWLFLGKLHAYAGWWADPDLIHVYGILPLVPEAHRAFRQVVEFCS